ncbi:MAG: HEAT repeat domain-containing protein [Symploca sp. SIO1C2]|nr:HEAT repeat domain-containing protein [Symploca sp. SIO1C2]
MRILSTVALRIFGKDSEEVHQALLALLTDEDKLVCILAAKALGKLGKDSEEVHQALLMLITDEEQQVRNKAARALLYKLGQKSSEIIPTVIRWIKQYQDSEYVGREIDVLWDLVVQDKG